MRILIINSVYGFASTGRICMDIAKLAQKNGDECMIACREAKIQPGDNSRILVISSPFQTKVHGVFSRLFDNHGLNSYFSTKVFLKKATEFDPDVVWLHNIHGYFINYELLFSWLKTRNNTKVKWTLHDCWTFTGHCSYFTMAQCEKWKNGCNACPQLRNYPKSLFFDNSRNNYNRKKKAFLGVKDLEIITPSAWLASLVKQSFLNSYDVKVVYNTIDTSVFSHTESDFRKKHALLNQRVLLGVANVWGFRKGLDRFIELAESLPEYYTIVLVGEISKKQRQMLPKNIIAIGKTNNAKELAEVYSCADVFLLLTREDNYPTVSIEAEACGTPVYTLNVGGCRETIHRNDSMVVETVSAIRELILSNFPKIEGDEAICQK